jgi:hypothetical protein
LVRQLAQECKRYKVKLIAPQDFEQLEGALQAISREKKRVSKEIIRVGYSHWVCYSRRLKMT